MSQAESLCVEEIAAVSGKACLRFLENSARGVKGIAHEGVACRGQVNANLVGPSRFDAHFQETRTFPPLQDPYMAQGMLSL